MTQNDKSRFLLLSSHDSMISEESFLTEKGYRISKATEVGTLLKLIEDKPDIKAIIVETKSDLPFDKDKIQSIQRKVLIPILFYCQHCDQETLDELNTIDHMGIIPAAAGLPYLESILSNVAKSGQTGFLNNEDPLERLIRAISESNRFSNKGNYGYITSTLLDAIIIDRADGTTAIANKKAGEILGLTPDEILKGHIYENNWQFIHEDFTPFPIEEHPHVIARRLKETVAYQIMGINRPGVEETLWISSSTIPIFKEDGITLSGLVTTFYDISEFVSIRKNHLRLAAIFQHAQWGIALGGAHSETIDQINPAYAKMHGYEEEELVGKPISSVFAPNERDSVSKHKKRAHKYGHYRFEADHIRKDGTVFPTVTDVTTIKDQEGNPLYRAVNVVDISLMKYQEKQLRDTLEELKKAKEYSESLFNKSPIAIYSVDKDCKVVHFNQKAEEITGYKEEDLIGNDFNMYLDALQEQPSIGKEFRIRTKNDEEKVIEKYSTFLYGENDEIIGDIESFIDITDWKNLQEYKTDIERIIRHDLKTPLNSIIGFPKLMLTDESLSDEYREYLMIILLAGENMLNLINASLNLYKLEQGSYQFSLEKTEVVTTLKQIRKILKDDCYRKKCKIEFLLNNEPLDRDFRLEILTEKSFLFMILVNLIKNAVEASPREETVLISITHNKCTEISIHNKGAIPEEIRNRFFEKNVTSGKKHGNGLGTYSAKLMADAIHANLSFKTNETEGTTLFLKL